MINHIGECLESTVDMVSLNFHSVWKIRRTHDCQYEFIVVVPEKRIPERQ
jgi:hypothetical protein